jgi:hypothetical protein
MCYGDFFFSIVNDNYYLSKYVFLKVENIMVLIPQGIIS